MPQMSERLGRVLVVDDNEDDQLQLRRLLRGEFVVVPSYSAAEALDLLRAQTFDALVTDQQMPHTSGGELIRAIKADPRGRSLPCILLSGRTTDEQLVGILRSGGVYHYFDKNKTMLTNEGQAELLRTLRNATRESRLERERTSLTQRLRSQVDALGAQYKLFRTLVAAHEPAAMVQHVLDSLVLHLGCDGAVALVDLRPDRGVLSCVVQNSGVSGSEYPHVEVLPRSGLGRDDVVNWEHFALEVFERLSGRKVDARNISRAVPSVLAVGEHHPVPTDPSYLPLFINEDLRGVVALVREAPIVDEERSLFAHWRDQLQDGLSRVFTQRMNEQRRLELMVEAMVQGMVMTDESGTVTLMNPAARRVLDLDVSQRPDFAVILNALGLSSLEILREFGPGENRASHREVRLGERDCQVSFSPVHNHGGAFVGWLTLMHDVTDQKRDAQRREEFVHIIGHELRSPLTSISGVLDLLGKGILGVLNERQLEYVEMARESCGRINTNLNDLLDLAKFETGKMPLTLTELELEKVVFESARRFDAAAIERGIRLVIDHTVTGLICHGDGHRLGQVVNNLVQNALKFTAHGGEVRVGVWASMAIPDVFVVTVHNTGEEIEEHDLERVFDKFEQVARADRRSASGTGLGLTICRSIVEGHGGQIWAESGEGEGTTFVFTIPALDATALDGTQMTVPRGQASRSQGQPLLVVAEDRAEALAVKSSLLSQGHVVRLCRPEVEAVSKSVAALKPALVLFIDPDGAPSVALVSAVVERSAIPVVGLVAPGASVEGPLDVALELPIDGVTLGGVLDLMLLRERQRRRMRVLVCDPDLEGATRTHQALAEAGYLAYTASDGHDALRRIEVLLPDLIIVDPGLAEGEALLLGLESDDLIELPVVWCNPLGLPLPERARRDAVVLDRTPGDLLVSVRMRLANDARAQADKLVILPGPRELEREVQARIRDQNAYAYCAIDIDGLRQAIERNGFKWGHEVMSRTAELVRRVVRERGGQGAFLGHQRDDDFVFLVSPDRVDVLCREISRAFLRLLAVIVGETSELTLTLLFTAIIDEGGRFERYTSLQLALNDSRRRTTGSLMLIDRGGAPVAVKMPDAAS